MSFEDFLHHMVDNPTEEERKICEAFYMEGYQEGYSDCWFDQNMVEEYTSGNL